MIVNRQRRIPVDLEPLAEFCRRVREELHFPEDGVTVRLLSDPAIARLNRIFRGKNAPTDVLSFPSAARQVRAAARNGSTRGADGARDLLRPDAAISPAYVGDIAISLETARRNARRAARPLPLELRILILHGMIHLAGYDHENDQGQMARLERRLLRRFGLYD
jgi:probable rRNA maturation factor